MTLSETVNRLAFEGISSPKEALLAMLIQGRLQGIADFRWSKYQRRETFHINEGMTVVPVAKWATLREALLAQQDRFREFDLDGETIELAMLQMGNHPAVEWEPQYDRFSYALRKPDTATHDPTYFEEVYAAQNISIVPLGMPGPDDAIVGAGDQALANSALTGELPKDERRGRRPKYDWPAASVAVFGMIHRGDLKPETQADVERALIAHLTRNDDAPSESTVRPFAKLIWEEQAKA